MTTLSSAGRVRRGRVAAGIAGLLLSACGGGGGDIAAFGTTATTVTVPQGTRTVAASPGADVSAANAGALGATVGRAVLTGAAGGVVDVTDLPGVAAADARVQRRLVQAALRHALAADPPRMRALASSSRTLPCPDASGALRGSVRVSLVDADNDGKLSNGDGLSFTLARCVVDSGLPEATGTFALAINIVELDGSADPVAVDVTLTFTDFSMQGLGTFNGSLQLWSRPSGGGERFRISYRSTAVAEGPVPVVYQFDVSGTSTDAGGSFTIDGGIAIGGATFSIVGEPFSFIGAGPPSSGSLRLVDAAGDALRLTAHSSALVDLDFFPSGALLPALSLPGLPWAGFRLGG